MSRGFVTSAYRRLAPEPLAYRPIAIVAGAAIAGAGTRSAASSTPRLTGRRGAAPRVEEGR